MCKLCDDPVFRARVEEAKKELEKFRSERTDLYEASGPVIAGMGFLATIAFVYFVLGDKPATEPMRRADFVAVIVAMEILVLGFMIAFWVGGKTKRQFFAAHPEYRDLKGWGI